jgi:hypothetical protein
MAVSVRMEALLERELELAAQRRGISKSQFIIEAVENALGHKDPGRLLQQVREEFAPLRAAEAAAGGATLPAGSHAERLRGLLRARHEAQLDDWAQRQASASAAAPAADRAKPAPRKRKGRAP